jgi:hypothetical protein
MEEKEPVRMSYVPNGIRVPTHGADWGQERAMGVEEWG